MDITVVTTLEADYPPRLRSIDSPPKQLYCLGTPLARIQERPAVAVVGSRNVSPYGRQVTYDFARRLAEQGIIIISGLALGVDTIAHEAALDGGGLTIAVLPSPVDKVYPAANRPLADRILYAGGTLVSEYGTDIYAFKSNYVARNRIVAGLAQTILITEAAIRSGSLHTANFGRKQGKVVMAIPGTVTSPYSVGSNNLLKQYAKPATKVQDILTTLNIRPHKTKIRHIHGSNPDEQALLDLLLKGVVQSDALLERSKLEVSQFNQVIASLEINGKIQSLGADQWGLT